MTEKAKNLLEQTLREGETVLWAQDQASVPRLWNWSDLTYPNQRHHERRVDAAIR